MHLVDLANVYGYHRITAKSLDLPVFHAEPELPPEPSQVKQPKPPEPESQRRSPPGPRAKRRGGSEGLPIEEPDAIS
jgi:hypothetical protein